MKFDTLLDHEFRSDEWAAREREKPENEPLDCPVCGQSRSFTIDPLNPASGYCVAEDTVHTMRAITVECAFCNQDTLRVLIQRCETCAVNYCRRGSDDDRFCVIAHDNMHEDKTAIQ